MTLKLDFKTNLLNLLVQLKWPKKLSSFLHQLREKALQEENNEINKMKYFNVSLLGLRGRLHPAVTNVVTTHAVNKMRPHIKMLAGNYLTYQVKSNQSGGSPYCCLCDDVTEPESLEHLISKCSGITDLNRI